MKSEKFTLTKHISFGRFIKMSMLSALLTIWYSGLQAQAVSCPLACNNLVQVSLDEDCIVEIIPDMMLEGQGVSPSCNYVVEVLGPNGQPLAPPSGINPLTSLPYAGNQWVTCSNIGQTLTVRVRLGANSCWGTIKIEDKLAPVVTCFPDVTVGCYEDLSNYLTKSTTNRTVAATGLPSATNTVHAISVTIPNDHQYSEVLRSISVLVNGGTTGLTVTLSKPGLIPNNRIAVPTGSSYITTFDDNVLRNVYQGTWTVNITSGASIPINSLSVTYSTMNFLNHPYYVYENCNTIACPSPPIFEMISDGIVDGSCGDGAIRATRTIKYRYKDKYGNLSQVCTHVISYSPITISQLTCPLSYDGTPLNYNHLNCNGTFVNLTGQTVTWDLNSNGYPDVLETGAPFYNGVNSGTGILGNNSICKINTTFSDTRIDICPQSFKILRVWTILDWCTGVIRPCNQIIKVIDAEGPVIVEYRDKVPSPFCVSGATEVITVNPYTCTAVWTADLKKWVLKIADCDKNPNPPFYIKFKKSPNSNNPIACDVDPYPEVPFITTDGFTSVVGTPGVITGENRYRVEGLPLGRTWIRFYISDACGNVTTTTTEIDVIDKTPPTPVCDEFTVVTLSNNGFARVFAQTFDDGSHDNCTPVGFQVSRMQAGCGTRDAVDAPLSQTQPGKYVQFCCEDLLKQDVDGNRDGVLNALDRGYVQVILTVWDDANQDGVFGPPFANPNYTDNSNTCMVLIKVEDKVPPVITCPEHMTIYCGSDTSAVALGKPVYSATQISTPYFTDNCPNPVLTWSNFGSIDNCGQGVITRIFTVTDNGGRTATCAQTITVRNNTPYNGPTRNLVTGVWKNLDNKEIDGCLDIDTDPSKTGIPELGNGPCSQVAYTYEDQIFPYVEGVCYKILRKWTVIDWCKFAPNVDPDGLTYPSFPTTTPPSGKPAWHVNTWVYTQVIKVTEKVKPVIDTLSKADTEVFGENCSGPVVLKNTASDCTPSAQLKWTYVIRTESATGPIFRTGSTNDASGTFPVGAYYITWTVEDNCGNQSIVSYPFNVLDKKKPTPYCISVLTTVIMPTTSSIEIWAKDFDKGSSDNCPVTACGLKFTFNGFRPPVTNSDVLFNSSGTIVGNWPTTNTFLLAGYESGDYQRWMADSCSSAKIYTCSDIGPNEENMSVWDAAGNTDYCTVTLHVQANGTACSGSRMAGNIGKENNEMIRNVVVVLQNMNSNETRSNMTDAQGHFEFAGMPEQKPYVITPEKNDDHLNGVSTLDLVMIQRHILSIEKFNSAYKYIAADVNKDNKVTAGDLVELRKLILGIYAELPNNRPWRFLDKAINITDIANPWGVNEYISITNFTTSAMNNNFVGVKIGDLNGSASANANAPLAENRSKALTFVTNEQDFQAGENIRLEITAENFNSIAGAQWTLNFDASSMEFQGVQSGAIKLNQDQINSVHAENGKLAFSWNDVKGLSIDKDQVLFTIEFRATANNTISNAIKVSSDITKAEAYTNDLSEINLVLAVRNVRNSDGMFLLEQNNPNPFTSSTSIGFTLPEAGKATLTIYDITGKVLKTIANDYPKGRSEVIISQESINAQGVMFYELECNGMKATKKMIYLNK